MILPLIPLILYLYSRGQLPWKILYVWLLGPPLEFPLLLAIKPNIAYNLFGMSTLALNMFLLTWTAWVLWRKPVAKIEPAPAPTGSSESAASSL